MWPSTRNIKCWRLTPSAISNRLSVHSLASRVSTRFAVPPEIDQELIPRGPVREGKDWMWVARVLVRSENMGTGYLPLRQDLVQEKPRGLGVVLDLPLKG